MSRDTVTTNGPFAPAADDRRVWRFGGMVTDRRKHMSLVQRNSLRTTLSSLNPTSTGLGLNLAGPYGEKPV